jgi:hypothetical protein
MKVYETNNELIFKETPIIMWIFGMFFVIVSAMLLYGALGGFTNYNEVGLSGIYIARFMAICGIIAGLFLINNAPISTIRICKLLNNIHVEQIALLGKTQQTISLDKIDGFLLIEDKDSEGDKIWTFGVKLFDDELIKLSSMCWHSDTVEQHLVLQANKFINREAIHLIYQ